MEKQIEEMKKHIHTVLLHNCKYDFCEGVLIGFNEEGIARELYDEGYRKQSEVIDEFVKKLKQAPIKCKLPLLGLPTKEEIEEHFDDIMLQVRDAIDSIAKEMIGE